MFLSGVSLFPTIIPPKAQICRCGLGQEAGTGKTANEQREGVVMVTSTPGTGDVPKEAAVAREWGHVGMLQHQNLCWHWRLGLYKLMERLWMRYRKGHKDYGTGGSSRAQSALQRLWQLCSLPKGQSKHFQPETWHGAEAGNFPSWPCRAEGLRAPPRMG